MLRTDGNRCLITFRESDLPNMANSCKQSECGFSLYRGVLVQWDEDHDERVLSMIDEMPVGVVARLLVVQEHKGGVAFLWEEEVPAGYEEGKTVYGEGDPWYIASSIALTNK